MLFQHSEDDVASEAEKFPDVALGMTVIDAKNCAFFRRLVTKVTEPALLCFHSRILLWTDFVLPSECGLALAFPDRAAMRLVVIARVDDLSVFVFLVPFARRFVERVSMSIVPFSFPANSA
jgi:hypothetical protein